MKKVLLMAGVACFVATTASAFEFNPYVAAKAKYAFARNEVEYTGLEQGKDKYNDNVWGGSFAVGTAHHFSKGDLRFELEYTKNADAKKNNVKVKTQGVLLNAYYDFNLRTYLPIKPYVGGGLGWGQSKFEGDGGHIRNNGVSVQIGGGVNYNIDEHISLDLGYRYISYGYFEKEYRIPGVMYEKVDYKPRAHEILFGVRYEF